MLFNSSIYMAAFLPVVLLGCILLRRMAGPRAAQVWVLVGSLVFYGFSRPAGLLYLLGSIVANYLLAHGIARAEQPARKRWIQLGLVLNIGYLSLFKYVNFFFGSIAVFFHPSFQLPDLEFPLGISFFTVMQIMYLVDTYEGVNEPFGLFDYGTFVSFFPYVISGPISKAKRIRHQFSDFGGKQGQELELFTRGVYLFASGLAKKVLLADSFAQLANPGFGATVRLSALEAWVFSICYSMQIYFDFSGYSDMAIGSALMLGIELPRNFDAPMRSFSVIEFWTRWHISLSQFITTYIFTPIYKSIKRPGKSTLFYSAVATILAMTIAGLWHGPAWTFVIYGTIHGLALACNQYWRKKSMPKIPLGVSWALTFFVVNLALLFFRSQDLRQGFSMTAALFNPVHALGMTTLRPAMRELPLFPLALVLTGLGCAFFGPSSDEMARELKCSLRNAVAVSGLIAVSCVDIAVTTTQSFLYFKF